MSEEFCEPQRPSEQPSPGARSGGGNSPGDRAGNGDERWGEAPDRRAASEHNGWGGGVFATARRVLNRLEEVATQVTEERYPAVLTYRQVVTYLVEHYPQESPTPVRGALLRQRRPTGWIFRLLYLDQHGEPARDPGTGRRLGRSIPAKGCDPELDETFAGTDLIIFD